MTSGGTIAAVIGGLVAFAGTLALVTRSSSSSPTPAPGPAPGPTPQPTPTPSPTPSPPAKVDPIAFAKAQTDLTTLSAGPIAQGDGIMTSLVVDNAARLGAIQFYVSGAAGGVTVGLEIDTFGMQSATGPYTTAALAAQGAMAALDGTNPDNVSKFATLAHQVLALEQAALLAATGVPVPPPASIMASAQAPPMSVASTPAIPAPAQGAGKWEMLTASPGQVYLVNAGAWFAVSYAAGDAGLSAVNAILGGGQPWIVPGTAKSYPPASAVPADWPTDDPQGPSAYRAEAQAGSVGGFPGSALELPGAGADFTAWQWVPAS